jgi:hypothetical protein
MARGAASHASFSKPASELPHFKQPLDGGTSIAQHRTTPSTTFRTR